MRNLVLILIAFIAAVTFIRAYDYTHTAASDTSETDMVLSADN
jgi:hypothetical protein